MLAALYRGDGEEAERLASDGRVLDVFEAAALGRAERVGDLLDGDPGLAHAWSADGFTALHLAAFFADEPDAALLLLQHGSDAGTRSRNGMAVSPLNSAAARGRRSLVGALLDAGAPVDAAQQGGYTALHSAAANGDAELVDLLLARGADPAYSSESGETPADLASERGHPALAERLRAAATGGA